MSIQTVPGQAERLAKQQVEEGEIISRRYTAQAKDMQIQTVHTDKAAMERAVKVIYEAQGLSADQIRAVALLAWETGLSPVPMLGHIYVMDIAGRKVIGVGTHGKMVLARREHEFILTEPRQMSDEERKLYSLDPDDVGAMIGILDMREVKPLSEIAKMLGGGFAELMKSVTHWHPGIWKKRIATKSGGFREDNVWNTGSPYQTAVKRARDNALRSLGLKEGVLPSVPQLPGYQYDSKRGAYIPEKTEVSGLPDYIDEETDIIDISPEPQVSPAQESQEAAQVIQDEDRVAGENAPNSSEAISGDENHAPETNKEKMSRPLPFPALREMIQKKAQNGDGMDIQMTNGQRKAMFAFMGNLFGIAEVTDEQIQAQFIRDLFEVETRSALTEKQFNAVKAWAVDEKAAAAEIRLYVEWKQAVA